MMDGLGHSENHWLLDRDMLARLTGGDDRARVKVMGNEQCLPTLPCRPLSYTIRPQCQCLEKPSNGRGSEGTATPAAVAGTGSPRRVLDRRGGYGSPRRVRIAVARCTVWIFSLAARPALGVSKGR